MNPLFNQSLEKGLAILCAFTVDRRLMTIGEIATACDMNRSSAQRMVYTLEQLGFIQRHPRSRRYQLTVKALQPGSDYLAANALIDVANPFLAELTNATRETTCLTEPYEGEMVYIARFISPRFIPVHMPIRSEEHTSELQSRGHLVCRLLLEKKKTRKRRASYMNEK